LQRSHVLIRELLTSREPVRLGTHCEAACRREQHDTDRDEGQN